jgi:hypothetical protein
MAARYDSIGRTYTATRQTDPRIAAGLARLRADLESGGWARRHADLLELEELDLGYRLLTASLDA